MVKEELISRSPLRILERSMHGALEQGGIGIIASRKGAGKTACLVHIATDQLLQGRHVVHISFSGNTNHIVSWYEDIFAEIARKRNLENALEVHDELIPNRVIMNFPGEHIASERLLHSVRTLIADGKFKADLLIIDSFGFEQHAPADLAMFHDFIQKLGISIWMSATLHRERPETDDNGVPMALVPYLDLISVLVTLAPSQQYINLQLIKDHARYPHENLHLKLDPQTLLIARE